MSVLENLRGRLHHVQNDIKASFRSLTTKEKPGHVLGSTLRTSDTICVDAGADVLNKFQLNWVDIHQQSEDNAKLAEEVDDVVSTIFIHCERQSKQLNQLQQESNGLAQLVTDMQLVSTQLEVLDDSFGKIEQALIELEDICEAQDMARNKKDHRIQLSKYDEGKRRELEHIKVKLAQEHASKVQASERRRVAMLKDRQEAFEEAFVSDLEHYKLTGRTESRISVASSLGSDHQVDIADIELDSEAGEKGALDAFLDEEVPASPIKEPTTPVTDELESAMIEEHNDDDDEDEVTPPVEVKTDEDLGSDCEILDKPGDADTSKGSDQSQQSKSPSETSNGWECVSEEKMEHSPNKD